MKKIDGKISRLLVLLIVCFLTCSLLPVGIVRAESNIVRFVGIDTETKGSWIGKYGYDGYSIVNLGDQIPSYATLWYAGGGTWIWADNVSEVRALQKPGSDGRIAPCRYAGDSMDINLNITGNTERDISIYGLDWDSNSRVMKVEAMDAQSGLVFDTRIVSNFNSGVWVKYKVKGNIKFRISRMEGANAVIAGVFFDTESTPRGTGIKGEYFDSPDFTRIKLVRIDSVIDFNWGTATPDTSLSSDGCTVRWTGKIQPEFSETYTFHVTTDAGAKLWINGQLVIDKAVPDIPENIIKQIRHWQIRKEEGKQDKHLEKLEAEWFKVREANGSITLTGGQKYDLKIDYTKPIYDTHCKLEWSSASQNRQVVPQIRLYPAPPEKVAVPAFTPASGVNSSARTVTISCATGDAVIRYTTDGSVPSGSSLVYSGPLVVSATTTIRAYAARLGMIDSDAAAASYVIGQFPMPSGTGLTGQYFSTYALSDLKLTRQDPALAFHWNYNAPDPLLNKDWYSMRWTGQIQTKYFGVDTLYVIIAGGARLWINGQLLVDSWNCAGYREFAVNYPLYPGMKYDLKLEFVNWYNNATIRLEWSRGTDIKTREVVPLECLYPDSTFPQVAKAAFTAAGGLYDNGQTVTISAASGSVIRYTTDGTAPTSVSPVFSSPITVNKNTVVRAYASISGMADSEVASAIYKVGPQSAGYFNNALYAGQDPFMAYDNGNYYYLEGIAGSLGIIMYKSPSMVDRGESKVIFRIPNSGWNSGELWAPAMYKVSGKWYIYYTAGDAADGYSKRHYLGVMECDSPDPWTGNWTDRGKLDLGDYYALDPHPFIPESGPYQGQLMLAYASTDKPGGFWWFESVYIVPMLNAYTPLQSGGQGRVMIIPCNVFGWEDAVAEGPWVLQRNGKIRIVYTGNGANRDTYSLGLATCTDGNVLNPSSWVKAGKVFEQGNGVYGTGRSCFVKSKDGSQDWMVYHSKMRRFYDDSMYAYERMISIKQITWNADNTPNLGTPTPMDIDVALPAGDPGVQPIPAGGSRKIEGEAMIGVGPTAFYTDDPVASNTSGIENINRIGNAAMFRNLPAANTLGIRYACANTGQLSLYVNDTHVTDISFPVTGAWKGVYADQVVGVEIPAGAAIRLQYDNGDAPITIDYIVLSNR
jgi:GH43 family beta-xylosidase